MLAKRAGRLERRQASIHYERIQQANAGSKRLPLTRIQRLFSRPLRLGVLFASQRVNVYSDPAAGQWTLRCRRGISRRLDRTVELALYQGGGHTPAFWPVPQAVDQVARLIEFLGRHLGRGWSASAGNQN